MKSIDLASFLEGEEECRRNWQESDPGANLARAAYEGGKNFINAKRPQPLRVLGDLSVLVAERQTKNYGLVSAIDWYRQAFFAYLLALDAYNAQSEGPSQKIDGFAEYLRGQMQVANGRVPWNYQPKSREELVLGQANLHHGLDFMEVIDAAERTYRDKGEDFLGLGGLGEVLEEASRKMLSSGTDIATVEVILDKARSAYNGALQVYRESQMKVEGFESRLKESLRGIEDVVSGTAPLINEPEPQGHRPTEPAIMR